MAIPLHLLYAAIRRVEKENPATGYVRRGVGGLSGLTIFFSLTGCCCTIDDACIPSGQVAVSEPTPAWVYGPVTIYDQHAGTTVEVPEGERRAIVGGEWRRETR